MCESRLPGDRDRPLPGRASTTLPVRRQAFTTLLVFACGVTSAAPVPSGYQTQFLLDIRPDQPAAAATIRVIQPDQRLRRLRLTMPAAAFSGVSGDGHDTAVVARSPSEIARNTRCTIPCCRPRSLPNSQ